MQIVANTDSTGSTSTLHTIPAATYTTRKNSLQLQLCKITIHIYPNWSIITVISQLKTKPLYLSVILELTAGIHW